VRRGEEEARFQAAWEVCAGLFGAERLAALRTRPSACRDLRSGKTVSLADLAGKRLLPFCGLARPEGFQQTLTELGVDVPLVVRFPDHHAYTARDAARLAEAYARLQPEALITTEKDAVKLGGLFTALPIWALEIEVEWVRGEENLERELGMITNQ